MTDTQDRNDMKIYFGNTVKALGDGVIEGLGVTYTSPEQRDLHGEYFDTRTDHVENSYKWTDARILYNHGFDEVFNVRSIGKPIKATRDDAGIWLQAQLDMADEYEQMVYQMAKDNKLSWSSGALPQSVEVDEDGHISKWAIIEFSLTPTPAMPETTRIRTVKTLNSIPTATAAKERDTQDAKELTADNVERGDGNTQSDNDNKSHKGDNNMDENMIRQIVRMVLEENGKMDGEAVIEEDDLLKAVEEDMPEETKADGETVDEEEVAKAVAKSALAIIDAKMVQRQKALDVARSVSRKHAQNAPVADSAYLPSATGLGGGNGRVEVGDNLKYAHLSPLDMAMAFKMATSADKRPRGLQGRKATDFVSEEFYRNAVHKMNELAGKAKFSRAEDAIFVKSAMPFKANELNASDITGQGLEYLGNVYDTMVWEEARNNQIYQLMLSRGMQEKAVPEGFKTTTVAIEGTDPTVYGGIEGNNVDATGRPETVYKITPQTTSTIDVTPGTFRTATAYTFELGEDSFIDMAAEANRKVRLSLEEHIEKAMINGDTDATASTNINDIAGTPTSTGLTRDYFLEFDGLRKSPLVTSSAYSRSGGTLAIDDYRRTWSLLGSTQAPRKDNIFFLIDFNTFNASLDLLPTLTKDVAGERASLFTGEFDSLWGLPVYMSGFMGLSNSAGKIDQDTPSNNTKGQIMAVYAPYWAFTFKRNISIEMQRSPESESFEFYGSMRFALTRRSASAASISYNLTV